MKVVWLVSGDGSSCPTLQKELDRSGASYLVRHAVKIPQIPSEHLQSSGVAVLIDSFHVEHTGFAGLKELRDLGFKGPIYMFGEPAPEKTTVPFTQLQLSGFFPALERADISYIAGLIHHGFEFGSDFKLPLLLSPQHKEGSAKISKHEDLDAITQKLSLFGARFGVKEETIRKAIMGLCMSHIQTKHGESQIAEPFDLRFGTDRLKIVLAVPGQAKGNSIDMLRNEFSQALGNFHNTELKTSALFQEFHHLVKAVNNLSIFGGSSQTETEYPDPLYLVTRIQFGGSAPADTHLGYYFSIHHTKPTENIEAAVAHLPLLPDPTTEKPETSSLSKSNVTAHSEKDLSEILNDPIVMGDSPVEKGEHIALGASSNQLGVHARDTKLGDDETIVNKHYLEKLKANIKELKGANETMSEDIFKLMKERKEPALDTELRKQNDELKAKIEKMEKEFDAAVGMLKTQIDELKGDPKKAA